MNKNIFLIEKDKRLRDFWADVLGDEGFRVAVISPEEDVIAAAAGTAPDLVFLGTGLDEAKTRRLLEELKEKNEQLLVVTPAGSAELLRELEAIRQQGLSYRDHPLKVDQVKGAIREAIRVQELKNRYDFKNLVGKSPPLRMVTQAITQAISGQATTVLILGETGTGKEEAAKAVHYNGRRAERPFLAVSCTAVPETLMESELFGHEAGAFTDARSTKKGLLELADGGTVFLDEIGDLKPALQAKLLRFLEEKKFRRVGGTKDIQVDIRIIAATNKDLAARVKSGEFREDLYYRLKVFPILLPPLRERREDIVLLAQHFISHFNGELKREVKGLTFSAREKLNGYHWPGNVRELRNVIERAMILATGDYINPGNLVLEGAGKPKTKENLSLAENEKKLIQQALRETDGNQSKAAELLGITRFALRNRMKKYGI